MTSPCALKAYLGIEFAKVHSSLNCDLPMCTSFCGIRVHNGLLHLHQVDAETAVSRRPPPEFMTRGLDRHAQIMLLGESDGFLNILLGFADDMDYRKPARERLTLSKHSFAKVTNKSVTLIHTTINCASFNIKDMFFIHRIP